MSRNMTGKKSTKLKIISVLIALVMLSGIVAMVVSCGTDNAQSGDDKTTTDRKSVV